MIRRDLTETEAVIGYICEKLTRRMTESNIGSIRDRIQWLRLTLRDLDSHVSQIQEE
jgi:hypothetical protein